MSAPTTMGQRIRQLREGLKISQQEIGNLYEPPLSRSSISKWEADLTKPDMDKMPLLAKKLKTTIEYLMTGMIRKEMPKRINDGFEVVGPVKQSRRWVPVKAFSKMGPDGYYTDMGYPDKGGDGYIPSLTASELAYAVRSSGGSMHPAIKDGWFCVCDPEAPPISGEYVQVCLRDGRCTIKEFISFRDGLLVLLAVNTGERISYETQDIENITAIIDIVPPSRRVEEYPHLPVYEVEYHS